MHSYECQRGGMADAVDSKSTGNNLVGSTPTAGTNFFPKKSPPFAHGARVPAALPPGYGVFSGGPALRQSVRRLNRRTPYLRVWYIFCFVLIPTLRSRSSGPSGFAAGLWGIFRGPRSPSVRAAAEPPYSLPSSMVFFCFFMDSLRRVAPAGMLRYFHFVSVPERNIPVPPLTHGARSAGSTHLRSATPWQARWHITVLPLRFSTGQSVGLVGRWVLGIVCHVCIAF